MRDYEHKAQYYESDQMGIIHHSNYIRWMEEARMDYLSRINFPMEQIEAAGNSVHCFTDRDGRIVILKKEWKELDMALRGSREKEESDEEERH
ncbi:MAG: hypothetical protein NC092_03775 [Butyrivibrio sp.]|nr:hypothetical protein [Butyrivibrio sp.]